MATTIPPAFKTANQHATIIGLFADFVVEGTLPELVTGMNRLTGQPLIDLAGLTHEIVARDREEAEDPDLASLVAGAGLVYLSGGNPPYCASTLRGTALWQAVYDAWQAGAAA